MQAHQLASVVLGGGSQSDDSSNTSVELELEKGMLYNLTEKSVGKKTTISGIVAPFGIILPHV